jgi:MoaA/NifB/PqqE/SkfB family radical SAM enzyme
VDPAGVIPPLLLRAAAPERRSEAPAVAFRELRSLWFQITGTLCNLACRHCFNESGPRAPWLGGLDAAAVRRHLGEAEALGVREIYFTGGEPFLHPEILALLGDALAVAPTTVLTNGTLIDARVADRLAGLAAASIYSLEVRVSLDGATADENDAMRGRGTFARALEAIRLLDARGLPPIVTATEILEAQDGVGIYERLRRTLLAAGVTRPRLKILPVLPVGRAAHFGDARLLSPDDLAGFDTATLQCTETRVVAEGGIYACPILAGLPGARVGTAGLADALGPVSLYHRACVTCHETGIACTNS